MKLPELVERVSSARLKSRMEIWRMLCNMLEIETMAEVGIWKGEFSAEMLSNCPSINKYYMIDPWAHQEDWDKPFNLDDDEKFEEIYREAMSRTEFAGRKRRALRGKTEDVVNEIPDNSLDLVYIDGDHTLRGITLDLISLYPKVKDGGYIGGDDFKINPWHHGFDYEPTLVYPYSVYYCEAMNIPIAAMPYDQFLIKKDAANGYQFHDVTGRYTERGIKNLLTDRRVGVCKLLGALRKLISND